MHDNIRILWGDKFLNSEVVWFELAPNFGSAGETSVLEPSQFTQRNFLLRDKVGILNPGRRETLGKPVMHV